MAEPIGIPLIRRRNHHGRTHHPSYPAAKSRLAAVGAIAVAGTLLVTGCGDQTKDSGDTGSTSAAPLADKLPQSIRDKGVVKVGSDIAYAPVEFKDDSGKVVGIDPTSRPPWASSSA
ncbi:hypothetical protein ACR6C2_31390 [Streptomyces sp. INA 01156]